MDEHEQCKEDERELRAELEAAISRADTAESSLMKAFNRIDELKAQLSEANKAVQYRKQQVSEQIKDTELYIGLLDKAKDKLSEVRSERHSLSIEAEELKEQLNVKYWPEQPSTEGQRVVVNGRILAVGIAKGDFMDTYTGDVLSGDFYYWTIPELVESPPTGEDDEL